MRKNADKYKLRAEELHSKFRNAVPDIETVVGPLIDEAVALERRMDELREMPFIRVHPGNAAFQKITPAAKLYKECSQSYMNAIRILVGTLKKVDEDAKDDLIKLLGEFSA